MTTCYNILSPLRVNNFFARLHQLRFFTVFNERYCQLMQTVVEIFARLPFFLAYHTSGEVIVVIFDVGI